MAEHVAELGVADAPVAVLVHLGQDALHVDAAQVLQARLQLVARDEATAVLVEEAEGAVQALVALQARQVQRGGQELGVVDRAVAVQVRALEHELQAHAGPAATTPRRVVSAPARAQHAPSSDADPSAGPLSFLLSSPWRCRR